MPIPFRDDDELAGLGPAGFLRIVRAGQTGSKSLFYGGLLFINARGEPVEFSYNRLEAPALFLWRKEDVTSRAIYKIAASLFSVSTSTPRLLFCRGDEVPSHVFDHDIEISMPVCRVVTELVSAPKISEDLESPRDSVHFFWRPGIPAVDSAENRLFEQLTRRNLLLEPFLRVETGLREVYQAG